MTKDLKAQKLLECKARAYDSIVRLHAEHDSHRRFHELIQHVFAGVSQFKRELSAMPTTASEQFPCGCDDKGCPICQGQCKREASCQVYRRDMEDQGGTLMCDECAQDALASGVFYLIEESCPLNGQDL